MARRRLQRKGSLAREGNWWTLRFREDVIDPEGNVRRVRRKAIVCVGTKSKREAQRVAWDEILSKLDQFAKAPGSAMTLGQFIEQQFKPDVFWTLKHAGREHYKYCIGKLPPTP